MSSQYCPICFFPVYLIIPGDAPGHHSDHVWEYTCLYSACNNFKLSMPESGIVVNSDAQVSDGPVDYPSWPLQQELPADTSSQTWFTQPYPQQFMHQESIAVAQASPGPATAVCVEEREPRCRKAPAKRGVKKGSGLTAREKARQKKAQAKKGNDLPTLEKPLSELPNGEGSDPITEITDYANRSVERRHEEATLAGRVKRPLNMFILYRLAYKRTAPLKQCPHQMVSRIAGQSWAIESDRVRALFKELADTERTLHGQAFPEYKFEPRRPLEDEELARSRLLPLQQWLSGTNLG